jgi:molybdate/tungstate transport system substrate-binding protein
MQRQLEAALRKTRSAGGFRLHAGNVARTLALALALAAVTTGVAAAAAAARRSGVVDVYSAGSLDTLLSDSIGPAFHRATGYTLVNTPGGSSTLAAEIRNRTAVADVFISAAPSINAMLEGRRNGDWVSWYASFAASPYVLGYYPKSRFAHDLRTMPWYKVITMPDFRLGRTNPTQDPGGVLAVRALRATATRRHLPALDRLASESSDEYSETTEQAGIQNGELDASFMYEADANSQHSPFVRLTGVKVQGDYTIALLHHAPHTAGAEAFIRFLLGPSGQRALRADHFIVLSPARATGRGVPAALGGVIR